ncbi:MAG: hypothetical protein QW750_07075 [Zestosphaera sp.]
MRRKCSEIYSDGDWIYAEINARGKGVREVRVITRKWSECRHVVSEDAQGRREVLEDEEIEW